MERILSPTCDFRQDRHYESGREKLADTIRNLPDGEVHLQNPLHAQLIRGIRPSYVFPELLESVEDESHMLIEIRVRALIEDKNGKLTTFLYGDRNVCEYAFDVLQSEILFESLTSREFVAMIRYAYSRRYEELERLREKKNDTRHVDARLEHVEHCCRAHLENIFDDGIDDADDVEP